MLYMHSVTFVLGNSSQEWSSAQKEHLFNGDYSRWSNFNATATATRKCSIEERLHHTREMCRAWLKTRAKKPSKMTYRNIVVDQKHEILLCVPYKSGASTHLNLLAQNSDAVLNHEIPKEELDGILQSLSRVESRKRVGLQNFVKFSIPERKRMLREYYKVMVVRHPLVRLLSMYSNKVAQYNPLTNMWDCSKNYYGKYLQGWISKHHPHKTGNCSLDMFVDYFVNHKRMMYSDMHTAPMHAWCNPCDIPYDYIVRLETGDSDQEYLLKNKLNPNFGKILHENPQLSKTIKQSSGFLNSWQQFQEVSKQQIEGLLENYGPDLALFGYEFQRHESGSIKTRCNVQTGNSDTCC